MRAALLVMLLSGSAALAQAPADACTLRCGEMLANCGNRCGADSRCTQGCMKHMDDCNQKCVARGKVETVPKKMPKMCPGANGKQVACAEMTNQKVPEPKRKPKGQYPNQAAKDLMKKQ